MAFTRNPLAVASITNQKADAMISPIFLLFPGILAGFGAEPPAKTPGAAKKEIAFEVPYRLSKTKHLIVRAKIDKSPPLNFVLDTGAPAFFLSKEAAKLAGLDDKDSGWAVADKMEFEGGLKLEKVKLRVETPFQLKGLNGLALAGVELHGMIGYNVLAQFEMEIDLTKDKMRWTKLDWTPPDPLGLGSKVGSGGAGSLELVGSAMAGLGSITGSKSKLSQVPGISGVVLGQSEQSISVVEVLKGSAAESLDLKKGDLLLQIDGETPKDLAQARTRLGGINAGKSVVLKISRKGREIEVPLTPQYGF